MSDTNLQPIDEEDEIAKIAPYFKEDYDLFLFYLAWLKNGLNATVAYKELHPNVKDNSAATLGGILLRKIDKSLLMQANGLDHQMYYRQLKEGITADRRDQFTGEMYPDHKTRQPYHDKLGKLLDIEKDKPGDTVIPIINIQINEAGVVEKDDLSKDNSI